MRICGVDIKGKELILAVIEQDGDDVHWKDFATKRIRLANPDSAGELRQIFEQIESFLTEHHIGCVSVKKRSATGDRASGGDTFRLEAVLQLQKVAAFKLITAQRISILKRSGKVVFPQGLNKYQEDAFSAAVGGLPA